MGSQSAAESSELFNTRSLFALDTNMLQRGVKANLYWAKHKNIIQIKTKCHKLELLSGGEYQPV